MIDPHILLRAGSDPATRSLLGSDSSTVIRDAPERHSGPLRVGDYMTAPVTVIDQHTPVLDAYNLMIRAGIRRLPVVDGARLVGIVSLGDLREARPSPATSLSIYELNYLLSKLTVDRVMTHTPLTATAAMPLQAAAALLLAHKIGGLPVVDAHGWPIGIITESDFFRLFATQWDALTGSGAPATGQAALQNSALRAARTDR